MHHTIAICPGINVNIDAYSNGLITNCIINESIQFLFHDIISMHYNQVLWQKYYDRLIYNGIMKYDDNKQCYKSDNLPHPIGLNTKQDTIAERYIASVYNDKQGILDQYYILIILATHGFWISSTKRWIRELYVENSHDITLLSTTFMSYTNGPITEKATQPECSIM